MLDLRKVLFDQSAKREKNFSFEFSSKSKYLESFVLA